MTVIESVVFRPVRTRLGRLQNGLNERVIVRRRFQSLNTDFSPFRQRDFRRQHHNTVFDFAREAHAEIIAPL